MAVTACQFSHHLWVAVHCFLVVFGVCLCPCPGQAQQLSVEVLPPVTADGPEVCLVVVPGAEVPGLRYRPLAEALQAAAPARLWVALTAGYIADVPNPPQLARAVPLALAELEASGMSRLGVPVFLAGHSLGGTFAQDYVAANTGQMAGLLLWGSYLTGTHRDLAAYPLPVMHLSGDLDGLTRVSRIADVYSEMELLEAASPGAQLLRPVVVLEGVNHGQFALGPMPPNVVDNDIASDLTEAEAWALIARASGDFLALAARPNTGRPVVRGRLEEALARSKAVLTPLIQAKAMERDGEVSEWVVRAQEAVINVPDALSSRLMVKSTAYSGLWAFSRSKPSLTKEVSGVVTAGTRARPQLPSNPLDVSLVAESAEELAAKMVRQEAVRAVLGGDRYNDTANCMQINKMALDWALTGASPAARSRYSEHGRRMKFNSDIVTLTGSSWLSGKLKLTYTPTGDLVVTSVALLTPVNFPIPSIAGVQYCKLLSPYRAMEWIYIDSLRPYP